MNLGKLKKLNLDNVITTAAITIVTAVTIQLVGVTITAIKAYSASRS